MNELLKFLWLPVLCIIAFLVIPVGTFKLIISVLAGGVALFVLGSVGWVIAEQIKDMMR